MVKTRRSAALEEEANKPPKHRHVPGDVMPPTAMEASGPGAAIEERDVSSADEADASDSGSEACARAASLIVGSYTLSLSLSHGSTNGAGLSALMCGPLYPDELTTIVAEVTHEELGNVGFVKGTFIDRSTRKNFHRVCDAACDELRDIGLAYCNRDGRLRKDDLVGFDTAEVRAGSRGGFVHIEKVRLLETIRRQDVGLSLIHALLTWLSEDAAFSWSLATMLPGILAETLPAHYYGMDDAERQAYRAPIERKVQTQWARLGFQQAAYGSDHWFLPFSRMPKTMGAVPSKDSVRSVIDAVTTFATREPRSESDAALLNGTLALSWLLHAVSERGRPPSFLRLLLFAWQVWRNFSGELHPLTNLMRSWLMRDATQPSGFLS